MLLGFIPKKAKGRFLHFSVSALVCFPPPNCGEGTSQPFRQVFLGQAGAETEEPEMATRGAVMTERDVTQETDDIGVIFGDWFPKPPFPALECGHVDPQGLGDVLLEQMEG